MGILVVIRLYEFRPRITIAAFILGLDGAENFGSIYNKLKCVNPNENRGGDCNQANLKISLPNIFITRVKGGGVYHAISGRSL